VTADGQHLLDLEAARLTEWLQGLRIQTGMPSPAMKSDATGPLSSP
jgi:hypothetical protein